MTSRVKTWRARFDPTNRHAAAAFRNEAEPTGTNDHKRAAAAILDKQTFYRDVDDTCEGIRLVDMVPNLSPQNLVSVEIGKNFMLSHGYIKNDFDVQKWAAPEFLEMAAKQLIEEQWKKKSGEKLPEGTQLRLG